VAPDPWLNAATTELPGDGLADDEALVEFMTKVREHSATRVKAASG
jgi:hypothetical protein